MQLYEHDIAVALLHREDPRRNGDIQLRYDRAQECEWVTMVGFGDIEGDVRPSRLRDAEVYILPDWRCDMEPPHASRSTLCVQGLRATGCNGDSGSPLIWENETTHQKFIVGVQTISGVPCGSHAITIYTAVYYHLFFIANSIRQFNRDELKSSQSEHFQPPFK